MNGGKVAVFNLDRSEGDEDADFLFLGPAETTLPKALGFRDVHGLQVGLDEREDPH